MTVTCVWKARSQPVGLQPCSLRWLLCEPEWEAGQRGCTDAELKE